MHINSPLLQFPESLGNPTFTKEQVSNLFGVSARTITLWISNGILIGQRHGRTTHFTPKHIQDSLMRARVASRFDAALSDSANARSLELISRRAIAGKCGVTERCITNWCTAREIPYYKLGRTLRFLSGEAEQIRRAAKNICPHCGKIVQSGIELLKGDAA